MKKKLTLVATSVLLVAALVIGGTLAYFTDTDSADNKFTTAKGGVKIELIEQQRGENGLEAFEQDKTLAPIVGSAQGTKDGYGMTTAGNYVDKIVTVKNLAENAYVRVYIAVPAALENNDASKNILHWNIGNKFTAAGNYTGNSNTTDYTTNMGSIVQLSGTTKIDGIDYNVYYQTYKKVLSKNEVTGSAFMVGLYLDENVDRTVTKNTDDTDTVKWTINGNAINFDLDNGVIIPVHAVGVQAAGFTDADAAINAGFGANFNPWAATSTTTPSTGE